MIGLIFLILIIICLIITAYYWSLEESKPEQSEPIEKPKSKTKSKTKDSLIVGETMKYKDSLVSQNGKYIMELRANAYFSIYDFTGKELWRNSDTASYPEMLQTPRLQFNSQNRLVFGNTDTTSGYRLIQWKSNSTGDRLAIENDGKLKLYKNDKVVEILNE